MYKKLCAGLLGAALAVSAASVMDQKVSEPEIISGALSQPEIVSVESDAAPEQIAPDTTVLFDILTTALPETTGIPETTAESQTGAVPETTAAPETIAVLETIAAPETTATPETTAVPETTAAPETTASQEPTELTVYWVKSGEVWHIKESCSTLSRSKNILSGTVSDAMGAGKDRVCKRCGG